MNIFYGIAVIYDFNIDYHIVVISS